MMEKPTYRQLKSINQLQWRLCREIEKAYEATGIDYKVKDGEWDENSDLNKNTAATFISLLVECISNIEGMKKEVEEDYDVVRLTLLFESLKTLYGYEYPSSMDFVMQFMKAYLPDFYNLYYADDQQVKH